MPTGAIQKITTSFSLSRMYPVVMNGWLRLRVALVVFLAGAFLWVFNIELPWEYDEYVQIALVYGGMIYLLYSGEWLRVLYEKGGQRRVSRTLLRLGTLIFFFPFVLALLEIASVRVFNARLPVYSAVADATGVVSGLGAVMAGLGLFLEWRILPSKVEDSARMALSLMEKTGYGIAQKLWVIVEPPFKSDSPGFAYTYHSDDESVIKVSSEAVYSDLFGDLDITMMHEMSHVYRHEKNHPSHNNEIIGEAMEHLSNRGFGKDYQQEAINDLVNYVREVYANDVVFKVLRASNMFQAEKASTWYQNSLVSKPFKSRDATRKGWLNGASMVRNSSGMGLMIRYGLPDVGDKAKRANQKFLSALQGASEFFDYFRGLVVGLEEDITEQEFRSLLDSYLTKFVEVAEGKLGPGRGTSPGTTTSSEALARP